MEDRTVPRFLAPVITTYIRELQDKGTGGECTRMLLSDLEELDREWNQDDRQSTGNCRGRKRCLTGVSFTPHAADLNMSGQHGIGSKRLYQDGRIALTHSQTHM